MNRPIWYRDHPDACTCVACDLERKTASKIRDSGKIGRNAPCPCESGKKYKKCHGR